MNKYRASAKDVLFILGVSVMSIGANLPEEMTAGLGPSPQYLLVGLVALVVVSLVRYLEFTLILAMGILAAGANLPGELSQRFGVDSQLMVAALVAMIATSLLNVFLKLPKGTKPLAQINAPNGAAALCAAAASGQASVVYSLVSSGVNPNGKDAQGSLPLVIAAGRGHALVVKLLLDNGANPDLADGAGVTALAAALKNNFAQTASLLKNVEGKRSDKPAALPASAAAA